MLSNKDKNKIKERIAAKVAQKLEEYRAEQQAAEAVSKEKTHKRAKLKQEKTAKEKNTVRSKTARTLKSQKEKAASAVKAVRQTAAKRRGERKSAATNNTVKENRLELLITIVNRSKGEYYVDLLQSFDVNLQFVELGQGTADEHMLSAFGLNDSDKAVIFSVIQESKLQDALNMLENKFATIKNGKGIAYTVPLSGVVGTLIFGFLSNNRKAVKENKQ